jgi:Domain of Unknown Function (DUF928)
VVQIHENCYKKKFQKCSGQTYYYCKHKGVKWHKENMEKSMKKILVMISALSLVLTQDFTASVLAAQKNSVSQKSTTFQPKRSGTPRKGTAGGGSRPAQEACLSNQSIKSGKLIALTPSNSTGFTEKDRPNFFVYLPQTSAKMAEFSLFDEHMNGVYQNNIPVNNQRLQSINLTSNTSVLIKNKPYYWTYALICNEGDRTQDWVVGGWVERRDVSRSLQKKLSNASRSQQVSLYAENGFWYEALSSLVEMHKYKDNNHTFNEIWKILLKSEGIDKTLQSDSGKQTSGS